MKVLRIIGVLVALVLLYKAAEWWVTCCVPRTVEQELESVGGPR